MAADTRPGSLTYIDNWHDLRGYCLYANNQNKVYLNRGTYFVNVADQVGVTERGESRGVALVDLTNSGKLDALIVNQYGPLTILRNHLKQPKNWVGLQLVGDGKTCNRDAAGTRVNISYEVGKDVFQQTREVQIANGYGAQGDRRLLFGLDKYAGPVSTVIKWCGRSVQRLRLPLNQYSLIKQPAAVDSE